MFKLWISYLLLINLTAFVAMFIDKQKAIHRKWRISEFALMSLSVLGGSIGMLLGMQIFRHKTKHIKFTLGVPAILIIQIISIILFLKY